MNRSITSCARTNFISLSENNLIFLIQYMEWCSELRSADCRCESVFVDGKSIELSDLSKVEEPYSMLYVIRDFSIIQYKSVVRFNGKYYSVEYTNNPSGECTIMLRFGLTSYHNLSSMLGDNLIKYMSEHRARIFVPTSDIERAIYAASITLLRAYTTAGNLAIECFES